MVVDRGMIHRQKGRKLAAMPRIADTTKDAATRLRFVDFSLRAWREGPYLQIIAHSTPAGGMRQPVTVKLGTFAADDYRLPVDASLAKGAELGHQLARLLLPDEVWRMLGESLQIIAPQAGLGLRLRLCLDDDLIDLPWEFLYRRDVEAPAARSGFLLLDGRISLVREPPVLVLDDPLRARPPRAGAGAATALSRLPASGRLFRYR